MEEKDAAWRAIRRVAGAPELQRRLSEFLHHAIAERKVLVENMLAVQHAGEVSAATMGELKQQERESRLRLMRSLLDMGNEVASVDDSDVQKAMQVTWLLSVNSLLAIDQVCGSTGHSFPFSRKAWICGLVYLQVVRHACFCSSQSPPLHSSAAPTVATANWFCVQASPLAPLLDTGAPGQLGALHLKRVSAALDAIVSAGTLYSGTLKAGQLLPSFMTDVQIRKSASLHQIAYNSSLDVGAADVGTPLAPVRRRRGWRRRWRWFDGSVVRLELAGLLDNLGGVPDQQSLAAVEIDMDQAVGALLTLPAPIPVSNPSCLF
jgi:hypothetical protein